MPPQDTTLPGWMQSSPAVQTLARTLLARYPAAFRAEGVARRGFTPEEVIFLGLECRLDKRVLLQTAML